MKIIAYNIRYDVDDEADLVDLPATLVFDPPNVYEFPAHCGNLEDSISEWLSDQISQETGFCHNGFEWDYIYHGLSYLPKRYTITIKNDKIYVETKTKNNKGWNKNTSEFIRNWSQRNAIQLIGFDDKNGTRVWIFKKRKLI